jgi:hypothetical protein
MAKKTKAQLEEERLQREEEERKAKLAEEKRLNEEAERKRLEDLRIQEERRVFRENELCRLLEEQSKLNDESVTRFQRLTAEEEYEMKRVEWEQYRNPNENDTMNMSESDMNTFLSLCEENTTQDWKELFDYVQVIQNVGQSIEYKWCESLVNRNENFQRSTAINIQRCVQQIYQKLDRATANFLRFAETKLNDRSEVLVEEYAKEVSIGIWGSYADIRPIRKSIIFEKQGIQIDVPKQILQHDAGFLFRIIRLSLDPYTPTAYHPPSPSSSNGTASATATGGTRAGAGGITGTQIPSHPPLSPPSSSHGLHASSPLYDTNQFTVIGDIITLDILRPPPPAYNLRAKRWILRDKSAIHLNLQKSHYPSSVSCKVLLRVPDEVMMTDDISLMWYDPDSCSWKPDGISDFQYTESNKTAQFYVTTVGTFALVKDRTHDFPYRRWSCTPLRPPLFSSASTLSSSVSSDRAEGGENLMRFTIMTQGSQEVVIDLIGTKVKLIRPMNRQLSDLVNVELPMGILLRALAKRGLNLLPLPQTPQQSKKVLLPCHPSLSVSSLTMLCPTYT